MFQLTYVTFYFGHFSLTTKPETNWTRKDLCPPITEHYDYVRFMFQNDFLTGFKMFTTKFPTEKHELLWLALQLDPCQMISMSQVGIIHAIALFDDSLRVV